MNYYFITGTSRGLGKSLVETLLKDDKNFVYSYSRNCENFKNLNYIQESLDLNDLEKISQLKFPDLNTDIDKIVLINNAGVIDINRVGDLNSNEIISTFSVNLISPVILCNKFISKYKDYENRKIVVNISSGASENPIDGWSTYCSSKSAIDMFTRVFNHEKSLQGHKNITMISKSPGIIDTNMQKTIRESGSNSLETPRFIEYNQKNLLKSPEETANKILELIY